MISGQEIMVFFNDQAAGRVTPNIFKMIRKCLLLCGILSSVLYVAMNIFVPIRYDDYNSLSQTISELSAIGAPTRTLWVSLGIIYTLLLVAFGWGIWQSAARSRPLRIAGGLIVAYGIIGLAWPFAPMHQREVLTADGGTLTDTMHLVMGMVSALFMTIAMGFGAAAFTGRFRVYSIITILILVVFGALTGTAAGNIHANEPTPLVGIWERIMIGAFLLWKVVLSIVVLRMIRVRL